MNRAERRAMERAARRPPPKSHGRAMCVPLVFGATDAMRRSLGLKDRSHIDAVARGDGTFEDFQVCVTVAVTTAHACKIASTIPDLAEKVGHIDNLLAWLAGECKAALQGIYIRHRDTGRVGVNGAERTTILMLADVADSIRDVLPRRVLHQAFERALAVPTLHQALGLDP